MRLPPLPTIGDIIRMYRLRARKQLSQNFLLDMSLINKIVRKAGNLEGVYVCEVGPGPGGITRALLESGVKHLYVIEKDRRFFPGLKILSDASGCLTAFHGDVLHFNMETLFPEECINSWDDTSPNIHIVGNLPFSVSTPLIVQYMEAIANRTGAWRYGRTKLTLTFQKEVAERIVAEINSEQRCRLSIVCQYLCHVSLKMVIPGRAFVPAPDVDVGVVHFVPRKNPLIELPFPLVQKVCRHLFHYRGKHCKHSLGTLFPSDRQDLRDELIYRAEVEPEQRSYQFTIQEINQLCQVYQDICTRLPYIYNFDYRDKKSLKHYKSIRAVEKELGLDIYGQSDVVDLMEQQLRNIERS